MFTVSLVANLRHHEHQYAAAYPDNRKYRECRIERAHALFDAAKNQRGKGPDCKTGHAHYARAGGMKPFRRNVIQHRIGVCIEDVIEKGKKMMKEAAK